MISSLHLRLEKLWSFCTNYETQGAISGYGVRIEHCTEGSLSQFTLEIISTVCAAPFEDMQCVHKITDSDFESLIQKGIEALMFLHSEDDKKRNDPELKKRLEDWIAERHRQRSHFKAEA
jgi:hypothetical protein